MVAVKYDGRTTDDIVFDKKVQIAVRLVEDSEEGVRRKIVEEIESNVRPGTLTPSLNISMFCCL